jgi:hypothetical protein
VLAAGFFAAPFAGPGRTTFDLLDPGSRALALAAALSPPATWDSSLALVSITVVVPSSSP